MCEFEEFPCPRVPVCSRALRTRENTPYICRVSSWKVYNLNDETDLENVISALTSLGSKSGPIAANKQSIKKPYVKI